jgi:predicted enzyme related to lactoylglutathione lyase
MDAIGRWGWLQIDCIDPVGLAEFWSAVLGEPLSEALGDPVHYVGLVPGITGAPVVTFQRVPEARTGKNRLHLDVEVSDIEAATQRVLALGGARLEGDDFAEYGYRWRVMADPEGNEFCLIY